MRKKLSSRRQNLSVDEFWLGKPITITLGFDDKGDVREIFADYGKVGSSISAMISDGLVLMSHLLQRKVDLNEIVGILGRESTDITCQAASVLGFCADVAKRVVDQIKAEVLQ